MLDNLAAWGVHDYWNTGGDYWNNRYIELRAFPSVGDKPIWMTEWAQRYPRGDLYSAMQYGKNILNALRLGASAWMAFEWVHPAANQSGLISTQWGEDWPVTRYWRSKAYYVFKQIANSSPANGRVVPIQADLDGNKPWGSIEYLAIRSKDRLVVHMVNDNRMPLKYRIVPPDQSRVAGAWLTDPTTNCAEVASPALSGILPPYSLLTIEID